MPEISVIIPTYNRFEMLERALNSVLSQNFKDYEIIVIDDASADNINERMHSGFEAEIEKGVIRYTRNEKNQGRSACRNTGIKLAQAGLIAFLDNNSEWLPDHLVNLYNFMHQHQDNGIAFSNELLPVKYYGGVERVIVWLLEALQKMGHKNYLLAPEGSASPFAKVITIKIEKSFITRCVEE